MTTSLRALCLTGIVAAALPSPGRAAQGKTVAPTSTSLVSSIKSQDKLAKREWKAARKAILKIAKDRNTRKLISFLGVLHPRLVLGEVSESGGYKRSITVRDDGIYTELHRTDPGSGQEHRVTFSKSDFSSSLFPLHLRKRGTFKITREDFGGITAKEVQHRYQQWLDGARAKTEIIGN